MKLSRGLVGIVIFVFLLVIAPTFSAVSVTINPANPMDSDALTCFVNGVSTGFNAHWKGSGVTKQGIIANPLPASRTQIGKATCEAYFPAPLTGVSSLVGSASVNIVATNPCLNNSAPVLNFTGYSLDQNSQGLIDLRNYIYDVENNVVSYGIVNNANVSCSILNTVLTVQSTNPGTASCTVRASDSCGYTDSVLNINVNFVDTIGPVVTLIDYIHFDEDTSAVLDLNEYVTDNYNTDAELTWNIIGNTNVYVDIVDGVATFTALANWSGQEDLTFTAYDQAGNYGQDNVRVIVDPVNDMPWIDPVIPDQTAMEDALPWTLDLKNYQHDVEIGPLTWTVSNVNTSLQNIVIDSNNVAVFSLVPNRYGTDTITFTLRDSYGATVSQDVLVTVNHLNHIPVINTFSPILNYVLNEGSSQLFKITTSDPDNDVLTYSWLLDGVEVSNINNYTFNALNGPETHSLIANVSDGFSSVDMKWTISVLNLPPVVSASADVVNESQSTTVTANSTDPGNDIILYSFDFNNDGSYEVQDSLNNFANYTWMDNGVYSIKIVADDQDGGISTIVITATVNDLTPTAVIYAPLTTQNEGSSLEFFGNNSFSFPDTISVYEWDWDYDGSFVAEDTGMNFSHIWMDNNSYVVALRVIDEDGSMNIATTSVLIEDLGPSADFIFSTNNSFIEPSTVSFVDTSQSYPDTIEAWSWDFDNDGIEDLDIQYPTHDFIQNGTYPVTLTVTDEDGSTNSITYNVIINDTHPLITDLSGNLNILEGTEATFNSVVDSYDGIVDYQWNFNDGNVTDSTLSTINHLFAQNGTYEVVLTVYEADGDYNTSSWNITVRDTLPQVFINTNGTFVDEGQPLQFYGNNSYAYDGILSYSWNFGDGTAIDNSQNPVHTFAQEGVYDVYLTVTDNDNSVNTTRIGIAVMDINPIANFTFDPLNPTEVDLVLFLDSSYSYDEISNYTWNFGDGNTTYSVQDIDHNFESGNYNITLTVYELDGDSSSVTKNIIVNDTKPVASFVYTIPSYELENVTFTSTSTFVHDPIVSWLWNFGDSNFASGEIVNHSYATNGTYNVSLTITDSDGSVEQTSQLIVVENTPVVVTLSAVPTFGNEPLNVSFTCTATGNAPFTYSFNFLTGSITTDSSNFTISTVYNNGTYNATCTVVDLDGDSNYANQIIDVYDLAPQTAFYFNPLSPIENETIQFTDNSTYVVDPITSWLWNFGDGNTNISRNPTHAYAQNGSYFVTLTTTDVDSSINSTTMNVIVGDTTPTVGIVSPDTVVENNSISFSGLGNGYDMPLSYSWEFGDPLNATIGTGQIVDHIYAQNGTYSVILTITDFDGSTNSTTKTINVTDSIPLVSFTFAPESPMEGDSVQFTDNSSAYDTPISWGWDFESDGIIDSTLQNPTHIFALNGPYMITLTVTDNDGSKVNATKLIAVGDFNPVANFTFIDPVTECSPLTLTSNSASPDGITNYTWNFGDGNTTTTTNSAIDHVFKTTVNGLTQTFVVSLTITEADGDTSSISKNIVVNDIGVSAGISNPLNASTFAENTLVNFIGSGLTPTCDSVISYAWNFGDLTPVVNGNITNHTYLSNGTYVASLTVIDSDGSQDIEPVTVIIGNNAPIVSVVANPLSGSEPTIVNFTCSITNGDMPYTYSINFGNGVTDILTTNSTSATFSVNYTNDGTFVGTCTVTDVDGDSGSASSADVVISDVNPTAVISNADPLVVNSGVPVTFFGNNSLSGSSSDLIGSYQWGFGDSTANGTTSIVNHTFNGTGGQIYTVVLTVKDEDSSNSDSIQVVINNPPTVSITSPTQGANFCYNATGNINFVGTITDLEDNPDPTGEWFYKVKGTSGDGTSFGIGNSRTLSMSSLSVGVYSISFIAVDNLGSKGVNNIDVNIQDCSVVKINEYLATNSTGSDWVELYNTGVSVVNITGWRLEDSSSTIPSAGYTLNGFIIPNGFFSVFVSTRLNDASTDQIKLYSNDNLLIDNTSYVVTNITSDYTNGRLPNGLNWVNRLYPTFNVANRLPKCSDGIDNDGDLLIDLADSGCTSGLDDDENNIAGNNPPIANAGPDQSGIITGNLVTLNGALSSDTDGTIASYLWTQTSGTIVVLNNPTNVNPTFTSTIAGSYIFSLVVTDNDGAPSTTSDSVIITVSNVPLVNQAPVVTITAPKDNEEFSTGSLPVGSLGDLDGNGYITSTDRSMLVILALGGTIICHSDYNDSTSVIDCLTVADLNNDSIINQTDIDIVEGIVLSPSQSIIFNGDANDLEDGILTGNSLIWTSNINGLIGTGNSFVTGNLSDGTHIINLTACDSDPSPLCNTTSIVIYVNVNSTPILANLFGTVSDGMANGIYNSNVKIYNGSSLIRTTSTNNVGYYLMNTFNPGSYNIFISKLGFINQTISRTLNPGSNNLDVILMQDSTISGRISGNVKDINTDNLIENARVNIYDSSSNLIQVVYTDSLGNFLVTGLPAITTYTITAEKTGYSLSSEITTTVVIGATVSDGMTVLMM